MIKFPYISGISEVFLMGIIRLEPVFKQMIWGGNKLRDDFGYPIDFDNCGECWGISAHPNGDCTVKGGEYDGMKLSELYDAHAELFGSLKSDRFPLLTKIIDAKSDLSIQVHPDDAYAGEHENGSLGKTECWYVIDAEPGTTIVIGHNAKDSDEVKDMIEGKRWGDFIREIPVKAGDFFMIHPGTVHAIKGGTLILESQQSSDITYRVYDYDRLQNGKPRDLHVRQSIDVIRAPFVEEEPFTDDSVTVNKCMIQLVTCDYFTVWKLETDGEVRLTQDQPCMLMSVIEGEGTVGGERVVKGDHFILPFGIGETQISGKMKMIVSSPK